MTGLQTEFEFTLPKGYVDNTGTLHRTGTMRLATAMDEIAPMRDIRVQSNQAYLVIVLLGRVITRLGSLSDVNAGIIERMFSADLAFLQEFYRRINDAGGPTVPAVCPNCSTKFDVELGSGGL